MDSASYGRLLRECGVTKSLSQGMEIHKKLAEVGADRDTFLGNNLVQMYGSCGCVERAPDVFQDLRERNVTIMLSAYAKNGHYKEAIVSSHYMDLEGIRANSVTFVEILEACSNLGDVETGRKIHGRIVCLAWSSDTVLSTAVLGMYSKCRKLDDAKIVFDSLSRKDVVAWTSMITTYSQLGQPKCSTYLRCT